MGPSRWAAAAAGSMVSGVSQLPAPVGHSNACTNRKADDKERTVRSDRFVKPKNAKRCSNANAATRFRRARFPEPVGLKNWASCLCRSCQISMANSSVPLSLFVFGALAAIGVAFVALRGHAEPWEYIRTSAKGLVQSMQKGTVDLTHDPRSCMMWPGILARHLDTQPCHG